MVISRLKILSLLFGILLIASACRRLPNPADPEPIQPPPQATSSNAARPSTFNSSFRAAISL